MIFAGDKTAFAPSERYKVGRGEAKRIFKVQDDEHRQYDASLCAAAEIAQCSPPDKSKLFARHSVVVMQIAGKVSRGLRLYHLVYYYNYPQAEHAAYKVASNSVMLHVVVHS